MARARKPGRGGSETARAREMRAVLREWEGSGITLTEFARRRSIALSTLTWWRHQLRRRCPAGTPIRGSSRFIELRPVSPPVMTTPFEIVISTGTVIRVGTPFDATALEQLVRTLSRC